MQEVAEWVCRNKPEEEALRLELALQLVGGSKGATAGGSTGGDVGRGISDHRIQHDSDQAFPGAALPY